MAEVCAECGEEFASPAALVVHARAGHAAETKPRLGPGDAEEERWYSCALCGARFRDPRELAQHNLGPHDVTKPAGTSPGA